MLDREVRGKENFMGGRKVVEFQVLVHEGIDGRKE